MPNPESDPVRVSAISMQSARGPGLLITSSDRPAAQKELSRPDIAKIARHAAERSGPSFGSRDRKILGRAITIKVIDPSAKRYHQARVTGTITRGGEEVREPMKKCVRNSVVFMAIALAGCAYGPSGGRVGETGQVQVVPSSGLPEPTAVDTIGSPRSYVIGPQDVLIIDVFGVEELTDRELVVDGAGRISIPLGGSIQAAGNTPEELSELIAARLRENYLRNPLVSVNVKEAISQFVTVDGQVTQPGNYPVLRDMTLLRAVASARGLGEFAQQDDVVILRTVGGQRYAGVYNIAAIRRGNYPDPAVYANDVVIVGDSVTLRRMRDFITILPAITSPLIYLLDNN